MSEINENCECFFCECPYFEWFDYDNINGIWICEDCQMVLHINNIQENGECCVCFENKPLIKLPTCEHTMCLECCKTIYIGSTTNNRPIHPRKITLLMPRFPSDINDDDDTDSKKQEEHNLTYEDLIIIRNSLISERPEWMNTEIFIKYENEYINYRIQIRRLDMEWEDYNKNKIRGNGMCPLCRKSPKYTFHKY